MSDFSCQHCFLFTANINHNWSVKKKKKKVGLSFTFERAFRLLYFSYDVTDQTKQVNLTLLPLRIDASDSEVPILITNFIALPAGGPHSKAVQPHYPQKLKIQL